MKRPWLRLLGKVAVASAFAVAVAALLLWLAGFFVGKISPDAPPVDSARRLGPDTALVEVALLRLPRAEVAVGTVEAERQTTVASRILSRVLQVDIEAGRRVEAEEVLVVLDDSDLRQQMQQAQAVLDARQATLDQAREELLRLERTAQAAATSELEVIRARNAARAAEAELQRAQRALEEAETVLGYATVRAPFGGVVIDRLAEVGDTVVPGTPLLTMYDPARMQLVASVRESLLAGIEVGDTVEAEIASLDLRCEARVAEIVPEASSRSRAFRVKVTGPCPPGVYPGMFGRLHVPVGEEAVFAIPAGAVRRVGQLDLVDVAVGEGERLRAVRRVVQLGRPLRDGLVEVLSGLRAGERVVHQAVEEPEE